jgi:hypothetical protein
MKTKLVTTRAIELLALVMIGDGVTGFFKPRRHSLLWKAGPKPFRELMENCAEHPEIVRWLYLAEAAAGIYVATREASECE